MRAAALQICGGSHHAQHPLQPWADSRLPFSTPPILNASHLCTRALHPCARRMGGVELGFMSTTTDRQVALGYMRGSGKAAKMMRFAWA